MNEISQQKKWRCLCCKLVCKPHQILTLVDINCEMKRETLQHLCWQCIQYPFSYSPLKINKLKGNLYNQITPVVHERSKTLYFIEKDWCTLCTLNYNWGKLTFEWLALKMQLAGTEMKRTNFNWKGKSFNSIQN